jgi:hypothetical protein
VLAFSRSLGERGDDELREEMAKLGVYCESALLHVRSGVRTGSVLGRLLMRDRSTEIAAKRCPDCAELVQSAARICRFCGYEFEPHAGH